MGTYLEGIAARRHEPVALAHRIALLIDKTNRKALVVEAGTDVFAYTTVLKRVGCNSKADIYAASGRTKVISTLKALIELGKSDYTLAIIDRDFKFSDPPTLLDGRCYVLDQYSIENLFIDRDVLVEFGHSFFSIDPDSEERQGWVDQVEIFMTALGESLAEQHVIGAACVLQRSNCNMGNFDVSNSTYAQDNGGFSENADALQQFLISAQVEVDALNEEYLQQARTYIGQRSAAFYFRGHYFWSLFVRMLNRFREQLDRINQEHRRPRARTRAFINERHAFEAATPFLPIPDRLEHFLRDTLLDRREVIGS